MKTVKRLIVAIIIASLALLAPQFSATARASSIDCVNSVANSKHVGDSSARTAEITSLTAKINDRPPHLCTNNTGQSSLDAAYIMIKSAVESTTAQDYVQIGYAICKPPNVGGTKCPNVSRPYRFIQESWGATGIETDWFDGPPQGGQHSYSIVYDGLIHRFKYYIDGNYMLTGHFDPATKWRDGLRRSYYEIALEIWNSGDAFFGSDIYRVNFKDIQRRISYGPWGSPDPSNALLGSNSLHGCFEWINKATDVAMWDCYN